MNLREGPIGIAGPRGIVLGSARWIVTQLTTLHSPSDLRLVLLLSDAAAPAWTWARWLPHHHDNVAADLDNRAALGTELVRLVDERLAHRPRERGDWTGLWTVLLLDRAGAIADLPGLAGVLAAGPSVGSAAQNVLIPITTTSCTAAPTVASRFPTSWWWDRRGRGVGGVAIPGWPGILSLVGGCNT